MHRVSAATSSGSMAGNRATRTWLRPSFRYDSVSTTPLARSTLLTVVASTDGSKSIVPTTGLRSSGLATNGCAYDDASAQPYSVCAERSHRDAVHSSPPFSSIHSTWFAKRNSVANAGVLYV